jgi:hypothetical protein
LQEINNVLRLSAENHQEFAFFCKKSTMSRVFLQKIIKDLRLPARTQQCFVSICRKSSRFCAFLKDFNNVSRLSAENLQEFASFCKNSTMFRVFLQKIIKVLLFSTQSLRIAEILKKILYIPPHKIFTVLHQILIQSKLQPLLLKTRINHFLPPWDFSYAQKRFCSFSGPLISLRYLRRLKF